MNTRDYKQFSPGTFYHVFNRGTAKLNIFCDTDDYLLFLKRLKENIYPNEISLPVTRHGYVRKKLPADAYDLVCYCLMPNHFHLLIKQNTDLPISKLMTKLCTSYSKCFNEKYERVGSLFQDQFKAVAIESNEQLLWLSAYIHINPLKGKLITNLSDYTYSSYLEYSGNCRQLMCKTDILLDQFNKSSNLYDRYIMNIDEEQYGEDTKIDGI